MDESTVNPTPEPKHHPSPAGVTLSWFRDLSLSVLIAIVVILLRFAMAARKQKVVTGGEGMIDSVGTAQTDLEPQGKIFVHGEIWEARASGKIAKGARVRVRHVDGLTLVVEPLTESR